MEFSVAYLFAIFIAGFIYIVTPGPVFLAIISLVSEKGRSSGFKFILGAVVGCIVWLSFTLFSLIETDRLPKILFIILSSLCSIYLFFLGFKMFVRSIKPSTEIAFKFPFRDGFVLALLNPKSYPVMVSVFGSVALHFEGLLSWENFPLTFLVAVLGFLSGYCFMVLGSSIKIINRFYISHLRIISVIFGCVFCFFGFSLLMHVLDMALV